MNLKERKPMTRRIVVMLTMDTDDPLLDPAKIDVSTSGDNEALRVAVVNSMPGLVGVNAVMHPRAARLMVTAHIVASEASGLGEVRRAPTSYRLRERRH